MRKEAKEIKRVNISGIQGYHEGGYGMGQAYAFMGFSGNYYFNSDRKIPLDAEYRRADGQELQGIGLEIETECKGIRNESVLAEVLTKIVLPNFKFGADMWKLQEDGSLRGDTSAEIISQVMTKSRIRNDYNAYKVMFNTYFPAFGISADSAHTSCGMHVNISNAMFGKTVKAREDAIRKLYYIINRHYDLFKRAFYRAGETCWCRQMTIPSDVRTMALSGWDNDHSKCLNFSHYRAGRIEIRLVGGQKNFACFRNTMETVFHVVDRVRTLKWDDCDDVVKIFSGCNQYVFDRLSSMCGLDAETLAAIHATVKEEDLI